MKFQVTEIEFDFDLDDDEVPISEEYGQAVIDDTIGQIWEVDDEEDLVDAITDSTGWCIKSIDYQQVFS
jgi:hypothetical protein